ncbi:MAG: ATP-binding protein, partial [Deltaproteobacteria bacterium]|nr:ATP-binding protein [Deltaproteobacteria bacterium]
ASVRIAGALGEALPTTALKGVAILPEIVLEKCRFLPGVIHRGLLTLLRHEKGFEPAQALAVKLKPYPLSGTPAFEKAFLASLDFS